MKSLSDQALFAYIQVSNYEAFNELYKRSWKALYTLAHRKTGSKEDAFDLVQNVFMDFYDKRAQLIINIPVQDYLRKSLMFKLSAYFRARGFQDKHYRSLQLFMENDVANQNLSAEELFGAEQDYQELIELIYKTINEMPEKMREIFMTSRTGNYSINQMAEKFGLSPQTVKNQISKAYSKLRQSTAQHHVTGVQIGLIIWLMI